MFSLVRTATQECFFVKNDDEIISEVDIDGDGQLNIDGN